MCVCVDESSLTRDDIEINTPETFASKSSFTAAANGKSPTQRTVTDVALAISTATEEVETEEEKEDEEDEEQKEDTVVTTGTTAAEATGSSEFVSPRATRRATLSPSKASLILNNDSIIDDSAISRRDTVSPSALKNLLQSISLADEGPSSERARMGNAAAAQSTESPDSDSMQEYLREMGTTNQFLAPSKSAALQTPESVRKTRAMKRKEREERTLSPSEVVSMTMSELITAGSSSAGKPKAPSKKKTATSPGIHDESSSVSNDSFTSTFFSSKLVTADDVDSSGTETLQEEEDEEEGDTPRKRRGESRLNPKSRRSTLEPTDAADFFSELRQEMHSGKGKRTAIDEESDSEPSSANTRDEGNDKRRQSIQSELDLDPSPLTRSKSRRATVDPNDIFAIVHATSGRTSEEEKQTRRDTLNVEDLYEINPGLASRKRKQGGSDGEVVSPEHEGKKSRTDADAGTESPPQDSIVSLRSKETTGLIRPQKSPTPRKQQRESDQRVTRQSARLQEAGRESTEFASPSSGTSRMRTPLKSILSARKPKNGLMTTPTKSVNFGPPQGAEFNLGSPSTSMTPMLAKDARRMFPLDRISTPPSPQEEDDDEETSLNTSLLDEADAIDSDEGEQKEGFEEVLEASNSRLSLLVSKSAEKSRRRYSLRGVSPLDNQANARRRRRSSVSAVIRSPVSARKLKGIGPGALSSLPAPSSASKSSFLSHNDTQPQGRLAYADSSASSDAGEDMEITGDFSNFVQAGGVLPKSNSAAAAQAKAPPFRLQNHEEEEKDDSLFADSPLRDETVELGSLGDLVAESAAYDTYPSRAQRSTSQISSTFTQDDGGEPTVGNLSDLAREDEQGASSLSGSSQFSSSTARRFNSLHYNQLDEQDITLDPIMEEEEDAGNSSAPSMMSIESSEDESDSEYDERRRSLVVNLSSKFERIGSGTPKARTAPDAEVTAADLKARITSPLRQSPRRKALPPAVPLVSMDELLTTTDLQSRDQATPDDHFDELFAKNAAADPTIDSVKLASISDACGEVVKWHIDEISSWSTGLSDVLGSLLNEKAPALFSPENLDESGIASIKALHGMETVRVQSGWCQWRAKMEREMGEKLQSSVAELTKDVHTLKGIIAKDAATKQSEVAALHELIEREKQMAELLDAIEEQQSVRNEYAATVDVLEMECASLSLEASVLHDQLRVVEGVASEGNHISAETSSELERQVLDVEEVAAIQGSLSVWRIAVATSSHLKLSAQFDDVVVRVDLQVDVFLNSPPSAASSSSDGGFSTDVSSSVTLKRRRRSQYLESDNDIVHLVQQKLFDPVQLSRFIRTASSSQQEEVTDRPGRICGLLQELERSVTLSFRFLRELRSLSAQFAVEFIADAAVLWVEFLNFTPSREAKFVVGFAILDEFPFTSFETSVHVVHGPVSSSQRVVCLFVRTRSTDWLCVALCCVGVSGCHPLGDREGGSLAERVRVHHARL